MITHFLFKIKKKKERKKKKRFRRKVGKTPNWAVTRAVRHIHSSAAHVQRERERERECGHVEGKRGKGRRGQTVINQFQQLPVRQAVSGRAGVSGTQHSRAFSHCNIMSACCQIFKLWNDDPSGSMVCLSVALPNSIKSCHSSPAPIFSIIPHSRHSTSDIKYSRKPEKNADHKRFLQQP